MECAMATATLTSKGQVTIPAETRAKLRLSTGSKIDFVENADGEIVLRPRRGDVRRLKGILDYSGPPATQEDIDAAVADAAVERFLRSKG